MLSRSPTHYCVIDAGCLAWGGRVAGCHVPVPARPDLPAAPVIARDVRLRVALDRRVTVKKVGSEKVKAGGQDVTADHYKISGGLERDLWFTADGKLIRQSLVKKGDLVEYVLK